MVFLVHHAEAVEASVDPQRPLTKNGLAHVQRIASEAASRGVRPDEFWHSGKLRARKTAEAFWHACNPLAGLQMVRGLQPRDPPGWIADQVAGETRTLLLVGHMPSLATLLGRLVNGPRSAPMEFPPHGMVALELHDARWRESWRIG